MLLVKSVAGRQPPTCSKVTRVQLGREGWLTGRDCLDQSLARRSTIEPSGGLLRCPTVYAAFVLMFALAIVSAVPSPAYAESTSSAPCIAPEFIEAIAGPINDAPQCHSTSPNLTVDSPLLVGTGDYSLTTCPATTGATVSWRQFAPCRTRKLLAPPNEPNESWIGPLCRLCSASVSEHLAARLERRLGLPAAPDLFTLDDAAGDTVSNSIASMMARAAVSSA